MNFTITSAQILAFCAFLTTLWGVWKIVKEIKKPNDDLKNTVARHDKLLDNDDKRLKEIENSNRMILQCLLVIINHDITIDHLFIFGKTNVIINQIMLIKPV